MQQVSSSILAQNINLHFNKDTNSHCNKNVYLQEVTNKNKHVSTYIVTENINSYGDKEEKTNINLLQNSPLRLF